MGQGWRLGGNSLSSGGGENRGEQKGEKGAGSSAAPSVPDLGRNREGERKEGTFNKRRIRDGP